MKTNAVLTEMRFPHVLPERIILHPCFNTMMTLIHVLAGC